MKEKFLQILSSPEFVNSLLALVTLFIGFACKKIRSYLNLKENENVALTAVEAGVNSAWEEFGKEYLKANEDGVITDDEKAHLREVAKKYAEEICKEHGFDLFKIFGTRVLDTLIRKIVKERKKENVEAEKIK